MFYNLIGNIDETIKKFQNQLSPEEEIVNTAISETKLVITTKINRINKNLLTDEMKRNKKILI